MSTHGASLDVSSRRYDLDWLRIIALTLLIFYHIGMYYSSWGWHVKSPHSTSLINPFMDLMNPWRLPLLFFISGVAFTYLFEKTGSLKFVRDRLSRLGPVIVFGVLVVVTPQSYFELLSQGAFSGSIIDFYPYYISFNHTNGVITPTWNHLWYVVYILTYSVLLTPIMPHLIFWANSLSKCAQSLKPRLIIVFGFILFPSLPFIIWQITITPHFADTKNLVWDWSNHAHFFSYLVLGVIAAKSDVFWRLASRSTPYAVGVVLISIVLYALFWPSWETEDLHPFNWIASLARPVYAWAVILVLLGMAARHLSFDGPARRYLTEAIFPVYVFHQTITVAVGYYLGDSSVGFWQEFLALVGTTFVGSFAGFEICRRVRALRPLVGLKL